MNIKVGQFNTGCENHVKQRLEKLLPVDLEDILGGAVQVTVSHCAQPKFNDIAVMFHVSLGDDRHFQQSFTVGMDDVRNLGIVALDKLLEFRSRDTVVSLKTLMDKVLAQ